MIDSHCHFDLPAFEGKHEQVLEACRKVGVDKLLVPGLTLEQFHTLLTMQSLYPQLDIALGCHPYFLKPLDSAEFDLHMSELALSAERYKDSIVAIGECGLDATLGLPIEYQQKVLRAHIHVAQAIGKPLILHHRQSHNPLIRILKQEQFSYGGVIHAFSGSEQIAKTYIDLGFVLGVGGTITYQRAKKTRATIGKIDLKHILLETDSPDMPVCGFQGMPNTPERLPLIADALAELQHRSLVDIQSITSANYKSIFSV